jgi:hypothetical protein
MATTPKYKRYGMQEWIAIIIGAALYIIQTYRYATNNLGDYTLEVAVFAAANLLVFSPLTILNLIRKAKGLDTK